MDAELEEEPGNQVNLNGEVESRQLPRAKSACGSAVRPVKGSKLQVNLARAIVVYSPTFRC